VIEYSTDERSILRLAEGFREMVATDWWREYVKVLDAQIADRELVLLLPMSDQHPRFNGMDFNTRAVALEVIKGALIGLRLAKSIPTATIAHASDIVREHSSKDDDNG
jgi:hypothetical protein